VGGGQWGVVGVWEKFRKLIKIYLKFIIKKKTGWGGGEKIKFQKKTEIRADQGKQKKSEPGMAQG